MIKFDAWYLPDGEKHLPEWMTTVKKVVDGRLTYQYQKYERALAYCRSRRTAVDVGAHVGLWSYWMARDFVRVEAFEPHPDHLACWLLNMDAATNARVRNYALGASVSTVAMLTGPSSSGDTYVAPAGPVGPGIPLHAPAVSLIPLDNLGLHEIDFLKVDCEGYEVFVIEGGYDTIMRTKPVICVEQKPHHGDKYGVSDTAAMALLQCWGYKIRDVISGDVILTKDEG